jgi:hypothetical protein
MNSLPSFPLVRRALLALALSLFAPLLLTQCTSVRSAPIASLTGEIRTPEHSLPRYEYPFDESGKYREDWVDASPGSQSN